MQVRVITGEDELSALAAGWAALAAATDQSRFGGPEWLLPWWRHYREPLNATPFVLVGEADGQLRLVAPLYRRQLKKAGLTIDELRLMGDAGPRPPTMGFTLAASDFPRAGKALADFLVDCAGDWDVIALEPFADPSVVRATMAQRLTAQGCKVRSARAGGKLWCLSLTEKPHCTKTLEPTQNLLRDLRVLQRISHDEWSKADDRSPIYGKPALALLEEVIPQWHESGVAHLLVGRHGQQNVSAALSVDDGRHAIVLSAAVDPEHKKYDAYGTNLLANVACAAIERERQTLDIVMGASHYPLPQLATMPKRAISLVVYGRSKTAAVANAYGSIAHKVGKAQKVPEAAAARARSAWARIVDAAGAVAEVSHYQLFRGELWTRGATLAEGAHMRVLSEATISDWDDDERQRVITDLGRDWAEIERRVGRGDAAVVAFWAEAPAGIVWAALGPIDEPRLGREIAVAAPHAYIHSMHVAPQARGNAIGPSMLEEMSRLLRANDVYQSWALVSAKNIAAQRTLQKAAYLPIADVSRHRVVGAVDKISVRPPDPAAKALLGL